MMLSFESQKLNKFPGNKNYFDYKIIFFYNYLFYNNSAKYIKLLPQLKQEYENGNVTFLPNSSYYIKTFLSRS